MKDLIIHKNKPKRDTYCYPYEAKEQRYYIIEKIGSNSIPELNRAGLYHKSIVKCISNLNRGMPKPNYFIGKKGIPVYLRTDTLLKRINKPKGVNYEIKY